MSAAAIRDHLGFLFDGAEGCVQVGAARPGGFTRENVADVGAAEAWLARSAATESVYVVPGLFRDRRDRTETGLRAMAALVMDLDDADTQEVIACIRRLPFLPTRVLQTSARGWQAFYLLDEGGCEDLAAMRGAQRALSERLGGDPGARGLVQPFRVPGTPNRKPGRGGFVVRVAEEIPQAPGTRVTLADLDEYGLAPRIAARERDPSGRVDPGAPPMADVKAWADRNREQMRAWIANDPILLDLWHRGVAAIPEARFDGSARRGLSGDGRGSESHADILFGLRLARLGFPVESEADVKRLALFLFARRLRAGAKWKASPWATSRKVRKLIRDGTIPLLGGGEAAA